MTLLPTATRILLPLLCAFLLLDGLSDAGEKQPGWKKHVVHAGVHTNTAISGDFTGDRLPDIISCSGGKTRLFVAPDWKQVIISDDPSHEFIHSEVMDVDGDGDLDYIGARYEPGLIVWLEQPENPLTDRWPAHLVDDRVMGIHGVLTGDVDGDGQLDLLATSAQSKGDFPNSLVWYRVPQQPRNAASWHRFVFAQQDAPGLTHYLSLGDINGDGRPDAATGAKGGEQDPSSSGEWFAWWEAPADPTQPWKKHLLSGKQPGATNIHPADVNDDGKVDLVASRGHGQGVIWFENPTWKEHTIHATLKEPHCLVVADIDNDGDLDTATCGYGDQLAAWFENDGKGNFTTHLVAENQAAYDIRATDLDQDGDLDLLIAGQLSKNVVWYENPLKSSQQKP